MVSTDAGMARATVAEYLGIVDNAGGIVGWIDEMEPGDREGKLIKFFRALIPDCGMQKAKIFSFVDEALGHLHRITDYPTFIAVGLEARRLLSERFGESPNSIKHIDKLWASTAAAEPSEVLHASLDSVLPIVEEMNASLKSMAEVAGVEPEKIQSATSIMGFAALCNSKFISRYERGEEKEARDGFYGQIMSGGGNIDKLEMALERHRLASGAFDSDFKAFEDYLEKAIAASDEAARKLDLLLAGSISVGLHGERSLAVIAALRHLRIAHDVPSYLLMPVAENRIAGPKDGEDSGSAGAGAGSPLIRELILTIDNKGAGAMFVAALIAERLSTDSMVRNA